MDVEFGNAAELETGGTGWFIGWSDWASGTLRFMPKNAPAHTLQAKWMVHPANDPRGAAKPPSEGRTISILVSETGRFRLEFSDQADFSRKQEFTLTRHGDFVIWGEGLHHRWFVDADCVVMTFRWVPGALTAPQAQ